MTSCSDVTCPNFPASGEIPYIKGSKNDIMWITDYPSMTDTYIGSLISGEAGEYLDYALVNSKLNRSEMFIASASRCYVDKKALPVKQLNSIMKCCQSKLFRAIRAIKPKLIIAAGELSAKQFGKSVGGVKKNRGLINNNALGIPVLVTYSPNFCVLNPSFQVEFERDVKLVKYFVENGYDTNFPEPIVEQVDDLEEILPEDLQSIAIDTETQGLDWLSPNSLLISFSVCFNNTHAYQIPLQVWADDVSQADYFITAITKNYRTEINTSIPIKRYVNYEKNLKLLVDIIENPKIKKYMFNGQFDLNFISTTFKKTFQRDIQIQNFAIDVQALAHVLDENLFNRCSLEAARKHFSTFKSQYSVDFDKTFDKNNVILIPKDDLTGYAALDAYATFVTAQGAKQDLLKSEPKSLQNYFVKFVMPALSYALPTLTMNGGYIDKASIPGVKDEIAQLIQKTHKEAIDLIPIGIKYLPTHKILKLSRNALIRDTLYHDRGFAIKSPGNTKGGSSPSVSSEARAYLKGAKIPKNALAFIEKYESWSMLNVLLTRYIKAFETNIRSDGRIHPTYSVVTTATGRSCLVKGTEIYMLDAREKVAIECVKPGDWVWSFKEDGLKPVPSQVVWSGKTKITNDLVRVSYQTQGNRSIKSIDCTPEHLFLLRDGSYKRASDLEFGDRLASIERFSDKVGYRRISYTGVASATREHMLIWSLCHNSSCDGYDIHHIDSSKANNIPNNLQCLTRAEHIKLHPPSEEVKQKHAQHLRRLRLEGRVPNPPKGELNKNYKHISKERCLELLHEFNGNVTYICRYYKMDLTIFIKKLTRHGIDYKKYKEQFDGNGDLITQDRLDQARQCPTFKQAVKLLHVNFYKAKELLKSDNNHMVLSVSVLNKDAEVYDLTIDGPPNFIANGVCVHNSASNPSWQNLPKRSESAKLIRRLVVPESGSILLSIDYSQAELRWCSHLSRDETMIQVYKNNEDLHTKTALALLEKNREEVSDEEFKMARRSAKAVNFSLLYGTSVRTFQKYIYVNYDINLSYDETLKMMNVFFTTYPGIKKYHKAVINFARKNEYVQSPYGRKRRLPGINSSVPGESGRCERQALNHAIQAAASDTALIALNELLSKNILDPKEAKPIMFVHDELVFEIKESKLEYYFPLIKHEMENPPLERLFGVKLAVPLKVDAQIGYNYADLEEYPAKTE